MQHSTAIDDSYIDDHSFGREGGDDVLLLIVASLTPMLDADTLPKTKSGEPIYTSSGNLTQAGLALAGQNMEKLANALTRPFNDDDCEYAGEYYEGALDTPLRFILPKESGSSGKQLNFSSPSNFEWIIPGDDSRAKQQGYCFFDPVANQYRAAFFASISRCESNRSGYLLYWEHVTPYLPQPLQVDIAGYHDQESCLTLQQYYEGEIDEEHDAQAAKQIVSKLQITERELKALGAYNS